MSWCWQKTKKSAKEAQSCVASVIKKINLDAKNKVRGAVVAYSYLQITGYKMERKPIEAKERLNTMVQKQKCAEAMFFIGVAFYDGDLDYPKDRVKAEQLFRELSLNDQINVTDKMRSLSCHYVANLYEDGTVVTKDLSESARFYELACSYGCKKSRLMLGRVYLSGAEGVFGTMFERNTEKGLSYLHELAMEGDVVAKEEVVKYHLKEAISWIRTGNSQGELMIATGSALDSLEWMLK